MLEEEAPEDAGAPERETVSRRQRTAWPKTRAGLECSDRSMHFLQRILNPSAHIVVVFLLEDILQDPDHRVVAVAGQNVDGLDPDSGVIVVQQNLCEGLANGCLTCEGFESLERLQA